MARTVTYYFSLVSPWAYLGHAELGRIAAAHDVEIDFRPVNLGELFGDTGGLPLPKRHPLRQAYRLVEMQRWRAARDLPLVLKPKFWPFDVKLADRAMLAASKIGPQEQTLALIAFAFRTVWVEEGDLANADTLGAVIAAAGFDVDAVLASARSPEIEAEHNGNFERAKADGVFGSPSYVLDGEVFWGQDRLDMLENAIASGRAPFTAPV